MSEFDTRFGVTPAILVKTQAYHDFKFVDDTVTFIRGFRGSGKTVLMNYLMDHLPDGWMSIYSANSPRLIENLSMQLYQKITSNNLVDSFLKYIDTINIGKFSVKFHQNDVDFGNIHVLLSLLEYWSNRQHVMIFIDEAVKRKELIDLLTECIRFREEQKPVSITITGIDSDINELKHTRGLTYLLRSAEVRLMTLNKYQMALKYQKAFGFSNDDGFLLANNCGGLAYGFQLMGQLVSENIGRTIGVDFNLKSTLEEILPSFKNGLFANLYQPLFTDLNLNQQLSLIALNHGNKYGSSLVDMAKLVKMKRQNFSFYLSSLVNLGLVSQPFRGGYAFSLSYFGEFLDNLFNGNSGAYTPNPKLLIPGVTFEN